jgi:hypothetical protein
MERGPLLRILTEMKGTSKELDLIISGQAQPMEIRNVVEAEELHSAHGIRVTTRQNYIWIDASHVAMAYQVRTDLDADLPSPVPGPPPKGRR